MTTSSVISAQQLSFKGVIKAYEYIVVPIMQRDYAQGRKSEGEIRNNFLMQLKGYLIGKTSFNDLDFVYGNINIEGKSTRFIPMDGQQRLTTLFLLHYYLSIHDGRFDDFRRVFSVENGEYQSRFSYETRYSSTHFCDAIFNNYVDYIKLFAENKSEDAFSTVFKDFGWFIASWRNDPTIDGMLRMLDSIHTIFSDQPIGLYERLVSDDSPAITFRLLPLKDNGLNEDLYIKMNSRGLPLTRFEKIKAKIIQYLSQSSEVRILRRTTEELNRETPIEKYFSYKIDTVWAYMFWAYKTDRILERKIGTYTEQYHVKECDSRFLNFIATIAANFQATHGGVKALDLRLLTSSSVSSWSSFSSLGEQFFSHLIDCLDAFSRSCNTQGIIPYCDNHSIDIVNIFKLFVTSEYNDRKYQERILFYAYYSFLIYHRDQLDKTDLKPEFVDWCRVVRNLTVNNRYNTEMDFCNAISSIGALLKQSANRGILEALASRDIFDCVGLDERQFKEERIKAWLIINDRKRWYEQILKIEAHEYLDGQIISILNLSGIEGLYDNYFSNDKLMEEMAYSYLAEFNRYSIILNSLFNKDGLNEEYEKSQLFRRALLAIGDYSMRANSNDCLLKNNDRDISWKRYLHQPSDKLNTLFNLLKDCPSDDISSHFTRVIQSRSVNDLNDWRGMLVCTPQIWTKLDWDSDNSKRAIRAGQEEGYNRHIYLLLRQRISGGYFELRSLYKFYILEKNERLRDHLSAPISKSDIEEPYILFRGKETVSFQIYYNYDELYPWAIYMFMDNNQEFEPSIVANAMSNGFVRETNENVVYYRKIVQDAELEKDLECIAAQGFLS